MSEHDRTPPNEPERDADFARERADSNVRDLHAPIMREMSEPTDGYEPVPLWLIFFFFALVGWGGYYIGQYSGGWTSEKYYLTRMPGEGGEQGAAVDPVQLGRRLYNNCRACHQADGSGVAGNYPPLVGSERVLGSPEVLARILLQGLEGPVEVLGNTYDNVMPGWSDQMTDGQIAAVLTYIRQEWGNSAPAVSEELVAQVREETSRRRAAWTDPELDAVDSAGTPAPAAEPMNDDAPTSP